MFYKGFTERGKQWNRVWSVLLLIVICSTPTHPIPTCLLSLSFSRSISPKTEPLEPVVAGGMNGIVLILRCRTET